MIVWITPRKKRIRFYSSNKEWFHLVHVARKVDGKWILPLDSNILQAIFVASKEKEYKMLVTNNIPNKHQLLLGQLIEELERIFNEQKTSP